MDNNNEAKVKLSMAARTLAVLKHSLLESLKETHIDLQRHDFIWHYLLQSFATLGGVSGWDGLIDNNTNYRKMSYTTINGLPPGQRIKHISAILMDAKVRYPNRKAPNIVACFEKIEALGGLVPTRDALLELVGRNAKISFLKSFPGIGDKYARNIMMDVYHEDFRDSIAIDSRIKGISSKWKLKFTKYADHEAFYLSVAKKAGLNGWELDRLMFRFQSVFHPPISIDD